jgi:lanosterol synthase
LSVKVRSDDVAVIGAGPVGCVTALAHAQRGASVTLFEAHPGRARRLAGEWIHPSGIQVLRRLGVDLQGASSDGFVGQGFVLFPDLALDPISLPYPHRANAYACEHEHLVARLRAAATSHANVTYLPHHKVVDISDHDVDYVDLLNHGQATLRAERIVGADGRGSIVRRALGLPRNRHACSCVIGLVLEKVPLPCEGYGHVFLGGPGPVFAYRIGAGNVRLMIDIPMAHRVMHERAAWLWEAFGRVLPEPLRSAFRTALQAGKFQGAANELCLRRHYGRDHLALVGDALGHCHPLTAVGLTLGFEDAFTLAESARISDYEKQRRAQSRVPELLALALYEVFTDSAEEAVALRQGIFCRGLRSQSSREEGMRYLGCEERRLAAFSGAVLRYLVATAASRLRQAVPARRLPYELGVLGRLGGRIASFAVGVAPLPAIGRADSGQLPDAFRSKALRCALRISVSDVQDNAALAESRPVPRVTDHDPSVALQRGVDSLLALQKADGGWEGEVIWCPMLAAQWVLMHHILHKPLSSEQRTRVLKAFARSRAADGLWGMHPHSHAYLYVTVLVYVAARLLGVPKDDELLLAANEHFADAGRVTAIPSWGKFWLAMLNLYDWQGMNPLLPELWALPRWLPMHPSRYYCHTRQILLGMAAIYGTRPQCPLSPVIRALRDELFPHGYDAIDFTATPTQLHSGDLFAAPGWALRGIYRLCGWYERFHPRSFRARCLANLRERIRWEMRTTDHTNLSPVSGFLNILALAIENPDDEDAQQSFSRLKDWIWEDDLEGFRVAGARSATWDTSFALQALAAAGADKRDAAGMDCGVRFLRSQQIRETFPDFVRHFRDDPKGGWCFSDVRHGWPISDCTAEALCVLLPAISASLDADAVNQAVGFILRCQNPDGGFGSYEASRGPFRLEWMNAAEMFGDSMTERSYVECTASCAAALALVREHMPALASGPVHSALQRARSWLSRTQTADGGWYGRWGVCYVYGTLFGVRGLLATGVVKHDPAIRKACRWLLERQHADGGWGEHFHSCLRGHYVDHADSHAIQTAWALLALLEAGDPDWPAIERGARYLAGTQTAQGDWPRQDMTGVFFRTALLEYDLYRVYFPVWALGLYEARRQERNALLDARGLSHDDSVSALMLS